MACSLYNNNGYGCGGCVHFVKTNSVTVQDGVLILNIPQATYSNKEKVCICIAQAIPDEHMQDKYHNKYKNKYNDTYTDKWKKKETKHNKTNK